MSNINEQIQKEKANAREVCSIDGNNDECAAAWDVVEELQAEASHQREEAPVKNSLEEYCSDNPEAAECRIYED
ncbi:MAG: Calvin cycle protein CP12 [Cyanobacteria bacterium P01_E01_bin.6]